MNEEFEYENKELIEVAMQMLIHSGDARKYFLKSMSLLSEFKFEEARKNIKLANDEVREAHKIQTSTIQKEASGERINYSTLFTHAQDTMMTAQSECLICENLINIIEKIKGDEND